MRFVYISLFFCFIYVQSAFSSVPDTAVARTFGGPGNEFAYAMAAMPDSGIVLAGVTNYYGWGGNSVYMVRTEKNGIHKWSRVLGGSLIDRCNAVVATGDSGIYLIGFTNSFGRGGYDGLIIKTDTAGNEIWSKTYGGSDWDFFNGACLLPDGSIIACGNTYSNGASNSDAYAVHIDQNGNILWEFNCGGGFDQELNDVTYFGNTLFFAGSTSQTSGLDKTGYVVKADLNGNVLSQWGYSLPGSCEINALAIYNSGLICAGKAIDTSNDQTFPWHFKIDTTGNLEWQQVFPNQNNVESYWNDVLVASNNDLIFIGQNVGGGFGNKTMLMIRTNQVGQYQVGHNFGEAQDEEGYALLSLPGNKLAACGYTNSWGFGNEDMLLFILPSDVIVQDYLTPYPLITYSENLSPIYVEENVITAFSAFPNPTSSILKFSGVDISQAKSILFYSIDGRENREMISRLNGNTINVKGLTPGFYTYKIVTEKFTLNGKVIIE